MLSSQQGAEKHTTKCIALTIILENINLTWALQHHSMNAMIVNICGCATEVFNYLKNLSVNRWTYYTNTLKRSQTVTARRVNLQLQHRSSSNIKWNTDRCRMWASHWWLGMRCSLCPFYGKLKGHWCHVLFWTQVHCGWDRSHSASCTRGQVQGKWLHVCLSVNRWLLS